MSIKTVNVMPRSQALANEVAKMEMELRANLWVPETTVKYRRKVTQQLALVATAKRALDKLAV